MPKPSYHASASHKIGAKGYNFACSGYLVENGKVRYEGFYKEDLRVQGLKAFGLRAETVLAESADVAANRIGQQLVGGGWKMGTSAHLAGGLDHAAGYTRLCE